MTLRKRLDKLDAARGKASGPVAVLRAIIQPSATGPELVALMLRPFHGGAVQIDRLPGESETDLRARFERVWP
jgi:hypothetical protein